jgi:hypothetical protein
MSYFDPAGGANERCDKAFRRAQKNPTEKNVEEALDVCPDLTRAEILESE